MRRKLGTMIMMTGTVLVIAALSLLVYNRWESDRAEQAAHQVVGQLEELEKQVEAPADTSHVRKPEVVWPEDGSMPTIQVEGNDYIGLLSIPRFGLVLPVMAQWSYPGLKIAPGRYSGSLRDDDLIISGHNYRRHFAPLKEMKAGDEVVFLDVLEIETRYQVTEIITLEPAAVEEIQSGAWDLTLFTCATGGQTRVVVRCEKRMESSD